MMLDLESVHLFVLASEYGNLTRAAEAAGTVQPVVSTRIKALEAALGRKLLERTPRYVRLTNDGTLFLSRARELLAAHAAAVAPQDAAPPRVTLGISDHALGTAFDAVLRRMRAALPSGASFTVRLGQSGDIRDAYEAGDVDLAVIRREGGGADGEVLGIDPLQWHTPADWVRPRGAIPLVLLPPPCAVRSLVTRVLDRAGVPWYEAFIGGSCLALLAAVRAGLGVAPLGRMIGAGPPDLSHITELPPLPSSQIVMLAKADGPIATAAGRALAASVRDTLPRSSR